MKTAFVATSYKHRHDMSSVLDTIQHVLAEHDYSPFIFVRQYAFDVSETKLMMETSFQHIRSCDIFIAELSYKVVGVGIEAGYAAAQQKPIFYLRQSQTPASTTMTGIADRIVQYHTMQNLRQLLGDALQDQKNEL